MKLFVLQTCPFCVRVLRFAHEHGIDLDIVEVPAPHDLRSELLQVTGQTFVPSLVDGDTVSADDDDRIIEYLSGKKNQQAARTMDTGAAKASETEQCPS